EERDRRLPLALGQPGLAGEGVQMADHRGEQLAQPGVVGAPQAVDGLRGDCVFGGHAGSLPGGTVPFGDRKPVYRSMNRSHAPRRLRVYLMNALATTTITPSKASTTPISTAAGQLRADQR